MQAPPPDPYTAPPSSGGKATKTVMIIIGVCAGGFCLVMILVAAILFPVFSQARLAGKRATSLSNVKLLATQLNIYAADYDDALPPATQWETALIVRGAPAGLFVPPDDGSRYAINIDLAGMKLYEVDRPADTPLVFESTLLGPNAAGTQNQTFLRGGRAIIGFANGSARTIFEADLPGLVWNPNGSGR